MAQTPCWSYIEKCDDCPRYFPISGGGAHITCQKCCKKGCMYCLGCYYCAGCGLEMCKICYTKHNTVECIQFKLQYTSLN